VYNFSANNTNLWKLLSDEQIVNNNNYENNINSSDSSTNSNWTELLDLLESSDSGLEAVLTQLDENGNEYVVEYAIIIMFGLPR
jgi:hypothetical protein